MVGSDDVKKQKFVRFRGYRDVHVRIAKALDESGDFNLAQARQVAKEDFFSDTGGDDKMTRAQLEVRGSHSLNPVRQKSIVHARLLIFHFGRAGVNV